MWHKRISNFIKSNYIISFVVNIIELYQSILKDLYGRSLKPFYDGDLPQEKLEMVLETKENK